MGERYDAGAATKEADLTARGIVGPLALLPWTKRVMDTAIEAIRDALVSHRREGYEAGHAAGMREGAERMRERAARDCEAMARASDWGGSPTWRDVLARQASEIRALPLDEASESEEADRAE